MENDLWKMGSGEHSLDLDLMLLLLLVTPS